MRRKKIKENLPEEKTFSQQIEETVKDLYYISETDSEIFPFTGEKAAEVSAETILQQLGRKDSVEERNFEDFFKRLTGMQEWFGEEEIATANKYLRFERIAFKKSERY